MRLKHFIFLAGLFLNTITLLHAQKTRPNIVLIFIDDMGFMDAGFNGSDFYQTPNINAFARQGMIFRNAYAGAGNCAPSRACLISGMYTPRHGVYAVGSTNRGPAAKMRVIPVPNNQTLAPSFTTIAEALRDNGYATAIFGKWHLGNKDAAPAGQGFTVDGSFNPPTAEDFKKTNDPKGIYRITEAACNFMEANQKKPFFLFVSHHVTHMPIQARQEMKDKMKGKKGKLQGNTNYGAMNAQMDDGVGILLKKIKDLGIEQNTVVIFTSDNGGLPQSPQTPLRGYKGMYYEGGIRVPFAVRWPGVVKSGTHSDVPVINVDLYKTFCDIAGADVSQNKLLDGESLVTLFKGGSSLQRPAIFWHFPGYLNKPNPGARDQVFRSRPVTTIRKGDWKLLLFHEEWVLDGGQKNLSTNHAVELYNIKLDTSEQKDLAKSQPAKRDELLKDLLIWLDKTSAKLANQPNTSFGKPDTGESKVKDTTDEDGE